MNFKSVLLGFLTIEDMSGYDLKGMMEKSVGFFFGSTYGSIYPALRELEKDGLVEKTTIIQQERPNKNVYKITEEGLEYLRSQLNLPPAPDNFRSEFLIRLFFGKHVSPSRLIEWIAQDRLMREAHLDKLSEASSSIPAHAVYERACHQFGVTYYTSTLAWLDDVERQVRLMVTEGETQIGPGALSGKDRKSS